MRYVFLGDVLRLFYLRGINISRVNERAKQGEPDLAFRGGGVRDATSDVGEVIGAPYHSLRGDID